MDKEDKEEFKLYLKIGSVILGGLVCLLILGMWGCPQYEVYEQKLKGEAALSRSLAERQVQIQDAQGKEMAAKHLAAAEVERAKGVSKANEIIGSSLKNNEAYLRWLYIEGLRDKTGEVIYVPTEAGLPILEAGRRGK